MTEKEEKYFSWSLFIRLIKNSREYYSWYVFLIAITVISSFTGVAWLDGLRRIVDGATSSDLALLRNGLYISIAVLFVNTIINVLNQYYSTRLNHFSIRDFQSKYIRKLTRIRMSNFKNYHSGDLITRSREAGEAQIGINTKFKSIIQHSISVIILLIYLAYLNLQLTSGIFIISLLLPLIIIPLSGRLRNLHAERQKITAQKDAFMQDMVQGGEVVRTFNLSQTLVIKFREIYQKSINYFKKIIIMESSLGFFQYTITIGGIIFVLGYGGLLVSRGSIGVDGLVVFIFSFERVSNPLGILVRTWPEFQKSIARAERVFKILDLPEEEISDEVEIAASRKQHLQFSNIIFSYDEEPVLKNITLDISEGEIIGLVGPSGSGKTSLFKLLLKFYEPDSGKISYLGTPLEKIPYKEWRSRLGYVSQHPRLFSGTIYENIQHGRPEADDEEIYRAAKMANIHRFIVGTEEGYQTRIGERGVRLSGGEKQRISIARAFLRSPEILLLDEPTSSLDSSNEQEVQSALEGLMEGRTTIVIAHRLSTIRKADRIIFLEDGQIQEIGSHNQLMADRGKYYQLNLQGKERVV